MANTPKPPKKTPAPPVVDAPPAPDAKFQLKCGEERVIYVDPIACTLPEGKARLVLPVDDAPHQSGLEFWRVKFADAPGTYRRRIMPGAQPAAVAASQPSTLNSQLGGDSVVGE